MSEDSVSMGMPSISNVSLSADDPEPPKELSLLSCLSGLCEAENR